MQENKEIFSHLSGGQPSEEGHFSLDTTTSSSLFSLSSTIRPSELIIVNLFIPKLRISKFVAEIIQSLSPFILDLHYLDKETHDWFILALNSESCVIVCPLYY